MKTYTNKLRCWAVMSSLFLMASAYPAFSQDNDASSSSQGAQQSQQGSSLNAPAAPDAQYTPRMSETETEGVRIDEPAGAATDAGNWSWIGLLGLLGLFGLKKRQEAHGDTYRPART